MPTEIVFHLRTTIEDMSNEKEADFTVYQLGSEWGKETVRISGEESGMEDLKTKAVLTAVHSGITNIEVELKDEYIEVTPFNSKIDDDYFLAGYVTGIISELLGEYHVAKITDDHFEVRPWEKGVDEQISEEEVESKDQIDYEKLMKGESYLIEDDSERASKTFNIFFNALEEGIPGLCMTTIFPSKIKDKESEFEYEFSTFWLSRVEGNEEVKSITAQRFSQYAVKIATSFLKVKHGIFMLHGMEFLFEHADPNEVIKAVQTIKDLTSIHDGIFLVAMDKEKIDEKEFNLVKSELEVLDV